MNTQIRQLYGLFALLFAVLVGFTSYWAVVDAEGLEDNPDNRRALIEEQTIPRGLIYARDGRTVLARNRVVAARRHAHLRPRIPARRHVRAPGRLLVHRERPASLELSRNDELVGEENEFESILSGLEDRASEGHDVVTNLDVAGTQAAVAGLAGRKGSVVAIEPQTGKVRVMVSIPEYDPNQIPTAFRSINQNPDQPLLNRSTQELYPPGSTFKVVTATAALDTGRVAPGLDHRRLVAQDDLAACRSRTRAARASGRSRFTDALTNSVNTVFAQVGEDVGRETLVEYMRRFGFYADPELDYPDFQMIPSGIINGDGDYVDDGFDVGRVAIGQGGLEGEIRSSPMQMALVAAAIGNGGRLMRPNLTDSVVRKDGRVAERIRPDLQSQVMKPETAEQLSAMMSRVVDEGTGTAAALSGVQVAGKTGTAEVGEFREFTQPWFICFAPVEDPQLAVAVTLERQPAGSQGGTVAAPIAKSVLEAVLGGG